MRQRDAGQTGPQVGALAAKSKAQREPHQAAWQDRWQDEPPDTRRIEGAGTPAQAWQASPELAAVPAVALHALVPAGARAVIVAPHPDDETLGCGGLIQALCAAGKPVLLVSVTDGDASHPGSARWPPAALAARRSAEVRSALGRLGAGALAPLRLGMPDGAVAAHEDRLRGQLAALLRPGDVLLSTWRFDGHPDHEACGRASAAVAAALDLRLLEFPVWAWHWASPATAHRLPWARARKLPLEPAALASKRLALAAFESQREPRGEDGPVLPPSALERLLTPYEIFFS